MLTDVSVIVGHQMWTLHSSGNFVNNHITDYVKMNCKILHLHRPKLTSIET